MSAYDLLSDDDRRLAYRYTAGAGPDLTIAPNGRPYLHRWHLVDKNDDGNVCFHIQVADDPERPLHDHPYDNVSVILAGGYRETMFKANPKINARETYGRERTRGDVVPRSADLAHHLSLLKPHRYAMTLFCTGPHIREWGFWELTEKAKGLWIPHYELIETHDGVSARKDRTNDNSV